MPTESTWTDTDNIAWQVSSVKRVRFKPSSAIYACDLLKKKKTLNYCLVQGKCDVFDSIVYCLYCKILNSNS